MLENQAARRDHEPALGNVLASVVNGARTETHDREGGADPCPLMISLVNVPYRTECGGFDGDVLDTFLATRDVEAAREYFYVVDGRPHLSCWIESRERSIAAANGSRLASDPAALPGQRGRGRAAPDPEFTGPMDSLAQAAFDDLRAWRAACAKRLGVPAYRVLTNRVMERIARAQPLARAQLGEIAGVGAATLAAHADEILAVLADARGANRGLTAPEPAPPSDATPPTIPLDAVLAIPLDAARATSPDPVLATSPDASLTTVLVHGDPVG